jgi:hypothetical protein
MTELCERAIERVREKELKEKCFNLCFKYLVCPSCGGDITKHDKSRTSFPPPAYCYWYKCDDCNWETYRSV